MSSEHREHTEQRGEWQEYREQLRGEALAFLHHPSLDELILASEDEGRIASEDVDAYLIALDDPDIGEEDKLRMKVDLLGKAMDWRQGGMVERHRLNDQDLSSDYVEVIKKIGAELTMERDVPIPPGDYDVAGIFGATIKPIVNRTDCLYGALEEGRCRARYIVNLGAERPLAPPDKAQIETYPYVALSANETDEISFATAKWLEDHGYEPPEITLDLAQRSWHKDVYGVPYRVETVGYADEAAYKPEWMPDAIITLSAPYSPDNTRAGTDDTVRFLLATAKEVTEEAAAPEILLISHQPYLLTQQFEAQRLGLEEGVKVRVAGRGNQNPQLAATVWGSEIAKAATSAYELWRKIEST